MSHASMLSKQKKPHRIAVLVMEHALPVEVSMPFLVFGAPALGYELMLCAETPGPVETDHGWSVTVQHGLDALATADTVIVTAFRGFLDTPSRDVLAKMKSAHDSGARIASICTGAFVLAAAGLLDGRRATTHWQFAADLARMYPAVRVDPTPLYIDEGNIITSAGVVSGIDLCLHLLRDDRGAAVANEIASTIVASPHRDGGQAQFIRRPDGPPRSAGGVGATQDWALAHLDQPLTVKDFASHAGVPVRTFERRFAAENGVSPIKWLNAARIDHARKLLETTDVSIDDVSRVCGLGTPANFRQHFRRATGTSPSEYRHTFASVGSPREWSRTHSPAISV
ncbi:Transcriptional regulator, AraC family [Leucobacter sp. 7(1)]|uniref:GlxA family transcriptional regulator n=1 Tax=Leucobacter sp. 7(1) TaxID=1255613 RepID=UPI00097EDDEC|nr:helix-turn-helix domain-containing protein [Leucobacter sp. 7(1)]SJN12030.1 Transcriptional regulator, AraC family [Leucobacter sp. 7(1)]